MEAKSGISDLVTNEFENQSPVSPVAPTTPDLSLDAAIEEAWQDILQARDSYVKTSNYSNSKSQGRKLDSSFPRWRDEAQMTPLSPDTPCQADGSSSKWGRVYSRRSKLLNQNAAEPRQSISDTQAQQSCDTSEELLGVDESGLAQSMSGMPVVDGVSSGGLLVDLNYPWDGSMSMDSIQYAEGDCITESEHYDDLHRNSDPDSFWVTPTSSSDRNKSMYAPMPEQSKLSPEIATSSTGQTEHGNYIEQKDGLTSTRADSQELENKDDAPPGSAATGKISTLVENHNLDKRSSDKLDQERALQRKPRKKKHRPKVAAENKLKRAPKPHTRKPTNPTEDPRVKRKYERRKKTTVSSTTPTAPSKVASPKERSYAVNSSRRTLNFDLDEQAEEGSSLHESSCDPCIQGDNAFSSENPLRPSVFSREEEKSMEEPNEVTMVEELNEVAMIEEPDAGAYDLSCSTNQSLKEYIQMHEVPQTSSVIEGSYSQEMGKVLTRDQKRRMVGYTMEGSGTVRSSAHLFGTPSTSSRAKTILIDGDHRPKRTFSTLIDEIRKLDATNGALCSPKKISFHHICKKRRTERVTGPNRSLVSSFATTFKLVGQVPLNSDGPGCNPTASKYYHNPKFPDFTNQNNLATESRARDRNRVPFVHTWPNIQMLKKKRSKRPTRVRDLASLTGFAGHTKTDAIHDSESQEYAHAEAVVAENPQSSIQPLAVETHEPRVVKKRSKTSSIETHQCDASEAMIQQDFVVNASPALIIDATGTYDSFISRLKPLSYEYMFPSPVPIYPGPHQYLFPPPMTFHPGSYQYMLPSPMTVYPDPSQRLSWYDEQVNIISDRLQKLDISREISNITCPEENAYFPYHPNREIEANSSQQQNAINLYQKDGTVVPYEGPFDPVKKRPPRAKVDLDEETLRVWNLLLENIDNEGIDGMDAEKAKWWENERIVFHGRVDSFIARMRLVQGDRRFSPWKGSVLDSVVGVFLTQNVSDHLSSSAFMSLAARYPPKRRSKVETHFEGTSASPEDPTMPLEGDQVWDTTSGSRYIVDDGEEKEEDNCNELVGRNLGPNPGDSCAPIVLNSCESSQNLHQELVAGCNDCFVQMEKEASNSAEARAMDDITSSQESTLSSAVPGGFPMVSMPVNTEPGSQDYSEFEHLTTSLNPSSVTRSMPCLELLKMAEFPVLQEDYENLRNQFLSSQGSTSDDLQGRELEAQQMKAPEKEIHGSSVRTPTISNDDKLDKEVDIELHDTNSVQMAHDESKSSENAETKDENSATEQSDLTTESTTPSSLDEKASENSQKQPFWAESLGTRYLLDEEGLVMQSSGPCKTPTHPVQGKTLGESLSIQQTDDTHMEGQYDMPVPGYNTTNTASGIPNAGDTNQKKGKAVKGEEIPVDWDSLRRQAELNGKRERMAHTMDSADYEALWNSGVEEIARTIKDRGMNNRLAMRIKEFLDRIVANHGSMDLEWLRDVPPDKAKEYLLSFKGLGLKSVECIRLLTLHHLAFPVDTNVGRIAVRLGWVPLQPLPESLQLHLLELYPMLESIQQYLWPRLCKLDQRTLYELHYHMITFGKVFCTKLQPNCNACPLRGECRHFASAFARARLALPGPQERSIVASANCGTAHQYSFPNSMPCDSSCQDSLPQASEYPNSMPCDSSCQDSLPQASEYPNSTPCDSACQDSLEMINPLLQGNQSSEAKVIECEPIIEVPNSPERGSESPEPEETNMLVPDIEDMCNDNPDEIPMIKLNLQDFAQTLENYMQSTMEVQPSEISKALVTLTAEAASIPTPKLKNVSKLRTEHHVYELPDTHPLLQGLDKRESDDPSPYLLAIWTPGETANSFQPPEQRCSNQVPGQLCDDEACSHCNSQREASCQIVRGTILIPCRTAMRGSFPLNGTYFQVNEVFADHDSSLKPIEVPRSWLWNLPRRTVYFGSSIPTIFRGMTTEAIQYCFWRGYVCVRGFDQKTRAPRPLMARFHFPISKIAKAKGSQKISRTQGYTHDLL
ncbi:hypothetical protein Drorol1_Dr00013848 [Drosera rotundifolia]